MRRNLMLTIFFFLMFFLATRFALAQGAMSSRRPALLGGRLLESNIIEDGQISLGINYEYEYLTEPLYGTRSIPNINRERTNSTTAAIFANYGFSNKFSLTAVLPFHAITNEMVLFRGQYQEQYDGGKYVRHTTGLGDIVIMLNYAMPRLPILPKIRVSGGVKLANGSIDSKDKYGMRFSDNLQLGSGSIDPIFAIFLSEKVNKWIFSGGILTRISSRGNVYGYKYGNELHGIMGLDYTGNELFHAGMRFSYLLTTRDFYQFGEMTRERGGKWLSLAPKLGLNFWDDLDIEVSIPVAVYQDVNESQLTSSYLIEISAGYRFSGLD